MLPSISSRKLTQQIRRVWGKPPDCVIL